MENIKADIIKFFTRLTFDEVEHKYFLNDFPINKSVSGLIKNFTEEFDSHTISLRIAARDGISQKEVLASWDIPKDKSILLGNKTHLFGEFYPFNRDLKPETGNEEAIVKFWNDLPKHIVPVTMELRMYHKVYLFAGTADILLYNTKTKTFIIGDYKTNRDLYKNFKNKKLLGVFSNLLDNPFNKYQIQLSFYQILFEQLGFKVSSRKLIWLRDDGTYNLYDTEDFTEILKEQLKTIEL